MYKSELRATLEALRDDLPSEHAEALRSLLKDMHLIEASLQVEQGEKPAEGRRVLSADKGVREDMARLRPRLEASADFDAVCAVQWVNPLKDDAVAWLEAGAPPRLAHRLC